LEKPLLFSRKTAAGSGIQPYPVIQARLPGKHACSSSNGVTTGLGKSRLDSSISPNGQASNASTSSCWAKLASLGTLGLPTNSTWVRLRASRHSCFSRASTSRYWSTFTAPTTMPTTLKTGFKILAGVLLAISLNLNCGQTTYFIIFHFIPKLRFYNLHNLWLC